MATQIVNSSNTPKTGAGSCGTNNIQEVVGLIGIPSGVPLDTLDNTDLITGIGAGTHFILTGKFVKYEPQNEDDVIQEGTAGFRAFGRAGKVRDLFSIGSTVGVMNELNGFNGGCSYFDIIRIDADGRLEGHSFDPSTGLLYGYTPSMVATGTLSGATDSDKAMKGIMLDYAWPKQFNELKAVRNPTYDITNVNGIALAYLGLNTTTTGDFFVAFNSGEFDDDDISYVSGLEGDFINSETGAALTGITESPATSGNYTGGVSGIVVALADPSAQSDDNKYSSTNTITIP